MKMQMGVRWLIYKQIVLFENSFKFTEKYSFLAAHTHFSLLLMAYIRKVHVFIVKGTFVIE